ncbi:MAG: DNA repair protein RecN [Bacteroidales bacterium]|nr:DNA repair protein RecN [Bacteroidales bacterium]
MLRSLQIRNYKLVDSLDIDFPEGLVIITGQTGAGKSILLGALSLLLGEKADPSMVSDGAGNCVVEAVFSLPDTDTSVRSLLEDNELDAGSSELIVRRVVSSAGRSRSFVNDSPVSVQTLRDITLKLVDIHSQHQVLLLNDKDFRLSLLDSFAGNGELLAKCSEAYRNVRSTEKELDEVTREMERLSAERDYLQSRLERLQQASLRAGELEELEAEQKQLANAEEIKQELYGVSELFDPSDPVSDSLSVGSSLKEMARCLDRAGKYLPRAVALSERVMSCRTELEDIADEVASLNSGIEMSQERLDAVDGRLSEIYDLLKKYSETTVEGLLAHQKTLEDSLSDSDSLSDRQIELRKRLSVLTRELEGLCSALSDSRRKASPSLSKAVEDSLHALELEHARFTVEVRDSALSSKGTDQAVFMFSSSGGELLDVTRCASGGEMSRLMLSLKAIMARYVNMPTLIFDEIDTGVSGSVADKIGRMICSMGQDMQVFAITHLPQVAAKGDAHYVVEKDYDALNVRAVSTVRPVSGHDRVVEIARMLSGSTITPAAIENAKELLGIG